MYHFKRIVLIIFFVRDTGIIFMELDKHFQSFQAMITILNDLIIDLQIVTTKLFLDFIV